jgi:hypothetical protein
MTAVEELMQSRRVFIGVGIGDQNKDGKVDVQPVSIFRAPIVGTIVSVPFPAFNVPVDQILAVVTPLLRALPPPVAAVAQIAVGVARGALGLLL